MNDIEKRIAKKAVAYLLDKGYSISLQLALEQTTQGYGKNPCDSDLVSMYFTLAGSPINTGWLDVYILWIWVQRNPNNTYLQYLENIWEKCRADRSALDLI